MRKPMMCLAWSFFVLAAGGTAAAQVGTEGAILGVVTDRSGGAVAGAEVVITNLDTGLQKTTVTNGSGNFEVAALPRGPYSVSASAPGPGSRTSARPKP